MFEVAKYTINKSPYKEQIQLLNLTSDQCISSLHVSPDIIFTETIDCGIVGEGFLSISNDINKIKNNNTIISPNLISQYAALVSSDDIYNLNHVNNILDFDLTLLNIYSTENYFPVRSHLYDFTKLSKTTLMQTYSYGQSTIIKNKFRMEVLQSAICHGIMSYFEAGMNGYIMTNNITKSHWHQAFHPFSVPIKVISGDVLQCSINSSCKITVEEVESGKK